MLKILYALGLLLLLGCLLEMVDLSQRPTTDQFDYPPVSCGQPCVIEFNPGGAIDLFSAQAREILAEHTRVIIDGPCLSACTLLVDIARDNVCLTSRALLGYHQWSRGDGAHGLMVYSTPGLNEYIAAHGGEPTPDSGHLLMLNFHEASRFYRACA